MDLIVQSRRKSEASDCWYEDGEGVMDEGGMGGPPLSRGRSSRPYATCGAWVAVGLAVGLGQCSKGELLEERSVSCHNPLLSRAFVGPNYSRNLHDLNCFPVFSSFANSHRCRIPSATAIPVSSNPISADAVGILPLYIALCLFIIPM